MEREADSGTTGTYDEDCRPTKKNIAMGILKQSDAPYSNHSSKKEWVVPVHPRSITGEENHNLELLS